ncbi:MAG: Long-chain-fatty-acid--CoA ligase [Candidatus Celerinatantimonas neptuna]|nr:MAG: Long-chain-fatty-acid--CoA ligase [Candidatus Celerinatantimonas neptuna]
MDLINQWLTRGAVEYPTRLALQGHWVHSDEIASLCYRDLAHKVESCVQQLQESGVKRVLFRADNSLNWALADLSAMKAGLVFIPVPTFFNESQVAHLIDASSADAFWGDWPEWDELQSYGLVAGLPLWVDEVDCPNPLIDDTQKITFTSGSTGQPKGVCLSRQVLGNMAQFLAKGLYESRVILGHHLSVLPLTTLLENICALYVPLALGACSIICRSEFVGLSGSSRFDANRFAMALRKFSPHSLVVTPALLSVLVHFARQMPDVCQSLRFVALGGAKVAPDLLHQVSQMGIPVYQGYGLSECASVVSLNLPRSNRVGSVGKPLANRQLKIDAQGHLHVKGSLMLGYLGQAGMSDQWLDTGDLARIDEDGFLYIQGRSSHLIITSFGRNISPEWVESEAQKWPILSDMVVFGDGQKSVCALVILRGVSEETSSITRSLEKAIAELNQTLPDYARIGCLFWSMSGSSLLHDLRTGNGRWRRQQVAQYLNDQVLQLNADLVHPVIFSLEHATDLQA